jgi:diguanylate cyclase (GGDEF)-like protein/PAS domain S-box-containing protein
VIFAVLIAVIAAAVLSIWAYKRGMLIGNAHYKDMIDQANDGVIICHLETRRVLYANLASQRLLGYSNEEFLSLTLIELFETGTESIYEVALERSKSGLAFNSRHRRKDGSFVDVEIRCKEFLIGGRAVLSCTTRDISVSKKAELQLIENQNRLAIIAHHDQLTGLPNRHYIADFLPQAIVCAKSAGTMLGIVFLDLDRFKHINDSYGHEIGDKLLQVVATRLRQCVRDGDVIVRMGGDEFVIVFLNLTSEEEVTRAATRIISALNLPIAVDDRSLQTSASLGISMFPRDGADMGELLKHSDTAMYQAKDGGRNNVQIFTFDMNRRLEHRVTVEGMLREALRLRQLDVYYQPLINLSTRQIIGLEALVRWRHPVHGMIPPDWFIPVAEETGLIIPIGNFVLHRALQDLSKWRAAGATLVPVSLNVAASQLLRGDFQTKITTLLKSHGLRPQLVQLEMTESGVFDSGTLPTGEARQTSLATLRDIGVKIAIDDFGTGYSSLAYLKHWRIDVLKIDKSFVRDLVTDASDLAIVSAIIAIARNLQIEVIAEGIEAYQQAEILEGLGCNHGQGYLFSRPMSADKCLPLLAKNAPGNQPAATAFDLESTTTQTITIRSLKNW